MQKIINQIQNNSNILGYVRTKKVVEILETNKRKSGKSGKYAMVFSGDITVVGCITRIDTVCRTLDILGRSYSVSDEHSNSRYEARKKDFREGKLQGVHFL